MRLFEISDAIERILIEETDHETGEIGDRAIEALEALEMERDEKALQVAAYLLGEQAESKAVKEQADRLATRARVHANRAGRLKAYLAEHCERGKKIRNDVAEIGWRKSKSVEIDDVDEVPEAYHVVTTKLDKSGIGKDLKDGKEVPGAHIVEKQNIQIR